MFGAVEYKPTIILDKREETTEQKPLALVGKMYCRTQPEPLAQQLERFYARFSWTGDGSILNRTTISESIVMGAPGL